MEREKEEAKKKQHEWIRRIEYTKLTCAVWKERTFTLENA